MNKNKTYVQKANQEIVKWYIADAKNQHLGRFSSKIAAILKGKNDTKYTSHICNNINIIIINAKLVKVTGNKREQKIYTRHSGRPGGLKTEKMKDLQERMPNKIIEKAVKGMLPKNVLGRKLFRRLKIYSHNTHPHNAQKSDLITII